MEQKSLFELEKSYQNLAKISHEQAMDVLSDLLIKGIIPLSAIPFPLRADRDIYSHAYRYSHYFGRFVKDVEITMGDILKIAEMKKSYLYHHNLFDIISTMASYLESYDFGGERSEKKFKETVYRPFIEKLQKLLPTISNEGII